MKLLVGITYNEWHSYLAALQPDDVIDVYTATLIFLKLNIFFILYRMFYY